MAPSSMTMSKVRKRAAELGITAGKMNKAELIRSIQRAEGFHPCFATSNGECSQSECLFHKDCIKAGKKAMAMS